MIILAGILYVVMAATGLFIMYKVLTEPQRKQDPVKGIAELQHWEYLRSLDRDANQSRRDKTH